MIALNRRRVMGGNVPYDARIEYLESTGTQYIDTGIVSSINTGVAGDVMLIQRSTTGNDVILGELRGTYFILDGFCVDLGGYFFMSYMNRVASQNENERITFSMNYLNDSIGSFNDLTINLNKAENATKYNIYLYGYNFDGSVSFQYAARKIRFYSVKFTEGQTIVRDFIPVRVGNVGYMYDKVSKQLFGNMGTGNFILGGDV